jgi:hypothetical protein
MKLNPNAILLTIGLISFPLLSLVDKTNISVDKTELNIQSTGLVDKMINTSWYMQSFALELSSKKMEYLTFIFDDGGGVQIIKTSAGNTFYEDRTWILSETEHSNHITLLNEDGKTMYSFEVKPYKNKFILVEPNGKSFYCYATENLSTKKHKKIESQITGTWERNSTKEGKTTLNLMEDKGFVFTHLVSQDSEKSSIEISLTGTWSTTKDGNFLLLNENINCHKKCGLEAIPIHSLGNETLYLHQDKGLKLNKVSVPKV